MGKLLVVSGIALIALGLCVLVLGLFLPGNEKFVLPFKLFALPGDFVFKGDNWSFYFPFTTCILLSLIFTALFKLVGWISKLVNS
ncbi:MAG: DUF2905 domain-containing protein [Candidatus Caenarcaniphilales bacterium]|nr:DUF2905 domain-containing protein [Candidatus Caenarcaniphilales bacterium]